MFQLLKLKIYFMFLKYLFNGFLFIKIKLSPESCN